MLAGLKAKGEELSDYFWRRLKFEYSFDDPKGEGTYAPFEAEFDSYSKLENYLSLY